MIRIPNKDRFYPGELPRILGTSRSTIYRKISEGKLKAEFISEKITIITRQALLNYLSDVQKQRICR